MKRALCGGLFAAVIFLGLARSAGAQHPQYHYYTGYQLNKWYYYPYQYFPHSYWPAQSPRWPEGPGQPYMKPPAYQTYPAFHQENWRYEMWQPQRYYRGNHFWLDQF